jgi:hypothetical protein
MTVWDLIYGVVAVCIGSLCALLAYTDVRDGMDDF